MKYHLNTPCMSQATKIFLAIVLLLIAGGAVFAMWDGLANTNTNENPQANTNEQQEPDARAAFIRDREVMVASRTNGEWAVTPTGIEADAVPLWNDDVLVTAQQIADPEPQGLGVPRFYTVQVDIRNPETYTMTVNWDQTNVETYLVSQTGRQILYIDKDYTLYLHTLNGETKLIDRNVHRIFDGGAYYPLIWNEDLAQITYTTFPSEDPPLESAESVVYNLARDQKTVVTPIEGAPILGLVEENGERWLYYTFEDHGKGIKRRNLETSADEQIRPPTGFGGSRDVFIASVDDPLYYLVSNEDDYLALVREDDAGTVSYEEEKEILDDAVGFVVGSNDEILVSVPKSSSEDLRLVAVKSDGTQMQTISEEVAVNRFARAFVWRESLDPLSYSIDGVSATVSLQTEPFDYTADQLESRGCGSEHDAGYFDQLVSTFSGTTKTIYNFKYTGESQGSDTFVVTLLPNKPGYTSLDQFKKDFDICDAGGDEYPKMLDSHWLLFVNACGTGFDDGSGRPIGCDKVKEVVEPTLKLNSYSL